MKFPSIGLVWRNAVITGRRFAGPLAAAVIGTICWMRAQHDDYNTDRGHIYLKVVMASYLTMLLLIGLTVYAESKRLSKPLKYVLIGLGIAAGLLYFFSLPDYFRSVEYIRFVLLALGLHFLISVVAFMSTKEVNGFWQYNKALFLRILMAALYSGVLYLGLVLALLAIEKLFSVVVSSDAYLDLWLFMAGIFNTWFFLAGFPAGSGELEEATGYPKALKIFTQFVLLPILAIYLLILYAYLIKIIINGQWPVGWVSYLVLGFSVTGILSLLLIHPIRNHQENKWILGFSRFFYVALFPLLILLFFAVKRRIADYGMTELRYFLLLLALWLLFIALYFVISREKNIKVIPLSLCLISFLSAIGPWGAFEVASNSQRAQLRRILQSNGKIRDGKIVKTESIISFSNKKRISSISRYMVETHGYRSMQPFFYQNLDTALTRDSASAYLSSYRQTERIVSLMGIDFIQPYDTEEAYASSIYYYHTNLALIGGIGDYDYLIKDFEVREVAIANSAVTLRGKSDDSISISFDEGRNELQLTCNHEQPLLVRIDSVISRVEHKNDSTPQIMISGKNDQLACRVIFNSIDCIRKHGVYHVSSMKADILLKIRK